jgi:GWxTD domain-containing protein
MNLKKVFFSLSLLTISITGFGQIDALFDHKVYYEPTTWKPYIETYLSINGNSIVLSPISNKESAGEIGIVLTLEKNNQVINFSKYDLTSPAFSFKDYKTFYDLQRLSIDTGIIDLTITLTDLNGDLTKVDTAKLNVNVPNIEKDSIHLVALELISSLTKDTTNNILQKVGYNIVPQLLKYYPENENILRFYTECYFPTLLNDSTRNLVLRYYIKPEGNSTVKLAMNAPKRITTGNILPILGQMNLETVPSGNYDLVLEVISQEQKIIAKTSTKIFRNNPKAMLTVSGDPNTLIKESFIGGIEDYDTLKNYIDCLRPIADNDEKKIIDDEFNNPKTSSIIKMQLFFYHFWYARNSLTPSESWVKYRQDVNRVNKAYGNNFRKGYESDRGIIYLKYGPPNTVSDKVEPSAYPYEIWFYQRVGNFSNKRFVFYSPTLIANDFVLLHSDMIGEVRNPNWVKEIYRRTENSSWGNSNNSNGHWGSKAEDLFNNPR